MEKIALCKKCGLTKPDLLVIIPRTADGIIDFICESCYLKAKDENLRRILTIINDLKADFKSLKALESAYIPNISTKADFNAILAKKYGGYRTMWHGTFNHINALSNCVAQIDIKQYPRVYMCEFVLRQWHDCLKNSTEAMNGETPILISKSFYLLKYTLEFAKFEILKALGEDIKDGGANENQR